MIAGFSREAQRLAASERIAATVQQIWHMPPTSFDAELIELIAGCAGALGYRHSKMVSGAGHDSLHTAQFAPTAMIFVPCAGGLSHNEEELATVEDLTAGANVLLQAVMAVAND
jgi:N-carbamoyl-L-amino-acid hydrolase